MGCGVNVTGSPASAGPASSSEGRRGPVISFPGPETRPAPRPLGAYVRGFAAFVVVMELRQKMPARLDSLRGQVDPALLADARPAWADLRLAAESWQSWRASIDGNAEGLAAEAVSASGEMSTEEARRCSL